MDDALKHQIELQAHRELQAASHHATRWTVYLRVLRTVARLARLPLAAVAETVRQTEIRPDLAAVLESHFPDDVSTLAAKDFHKKSEILRTLEAMHRKKPDVVRRVMAVDGFRGTGLAGYLENLAVGLSPDGDDDEGGFRARHVRAVRRLCDETSDVRGVLERAFLRQTREEDEGVRLYVREVGRENLESVAAWRRRSDEEEAREEKTSKKRKRDKSTGSGKKKRKTNKDVASTTTVVVEPPEEEEEKVRNEDDSDSD